MLGVQQRAQELSDAQLRRQVLGWAGPSRQVQREISRVPFNARLAARPGHRSCGEGSPLPWVRGAPLPRRQRPSVRCRLTGLSCRGGRRGPGAGAALLLSVVAGLVLPWEPSGLRALGLTAQPAGGSHVSVSPQAPDGALCPRETCSCTLAVAVTSTPPAVQPAAPAWVSTSDRTNSRGASTTSLPSRAALGGAPCVALKPHGSPPGASGPLAPPA